MLIVDFDPERPRDKGQYHVRLIDAASGDFGNDAKHQSQLGYWCDLGHLTAGILATVLAHVDDDELERVRRYARPKQPFTAEFTPEERETIRYRLGLASSRMGRVSRER